MSLEIRTRAYVAYLLRVIVLGLVVVSVPPQVGVGPELATVSPAGSTSVTATPGLASKLVVCNKEFAGWR